LWLPCPGTSGRPMRWSEGLSRRHKNASCPDAFRSRGYRFVATRRRREGCCARKRRSREAPCSRASIAAKRQRHALELSARQRPDLEVPGRLSRTISSPARRRWARATARRRRRSGGMRARSGRPRVRSPRSRRRRRAPGPCPAWPAPQESLSRSRRTESRADRCRASRRDRTALITSHTIRSVWRAGARSAPWSETSGDCARRRANRSLLSPLVDRPFSQFRNTRDTRDRRNCSGTVGKTPGTPQLRFRQPAAASWATPVLDKEVAFRRRCPVSTVSRPAC
jgi:hypothetical protein